MNYFSKNIYGLLYVMEYKVILNCWVYPLGKQYLNNGEWCVILYSGKVQMYMKARYAREVSMLYVAAHFNLRNKNTILK